MANQLGIQIINGELYINGVKYSTSGGSIHNTFNKICVYGTSIEQTPGGAKTWSRYMADALGLTYGTQVINHAKGGGSVTWYGNDTYITEQITAYKGNVLNAFSCSVAEKTAAANYFLSQGLITQQEIDNAVSNGGWGMCYDLSLLQEQDVDLYIFGTYGINDRQPWMKWTDEDSLEQTSFTIHPETAFDRRTIFGAYNYVLRELYRQNPTAKVVILGQHTRQWDLSGDGTDNHSQTSVNGAQQSVAEVWDIPFADWGVNLPLNSTFYKATKVKVNANTDRKETIWNQDDVHLNDDGAKLLGTWVAEWITKTELKPLNPRWTIE